VVTVVGPADRGILAPYVDPRDGKIYQTVKMPDDKVWFAQNLNYTKDLAYNTASNVANGKAFTSTDNGIPAIGSYWCPPLYWTNGGTLTPVASGNQSACEVYGALYTWETAMMVDGKYSDDTKTSTGWVEPSASYLAPGVAPASGPAATYNLARGTTKRGICPAGWHVPTVYEWANLLDKVGGTTAFTTSTAIDVWLGTNEGKQLKSKEVFNGTDTGEGAWLKTADPGTNDTGFGATPGGSRISTGQQFLYRGLVSYFQSSNVADAHVPWVFEIQHGLSTARFRMSLRSAGVGLRCVRDE
jgi:uncharacterized protein (TIGR02145 family)